MTTRGRFNCDKHVLTRLALTCIVAGTVTACVRSSSEVAGTENLPVWAAELLSDELELKIVDTDSLHVTAVFNGDALEMANDIAQGNPGSDYLSLPGRPVVSIESEHGLVVLTWTPREHPGLWQLDALLAPAK